MPTISVTINGVQYHEEVEPRLLLVDFLRDRLRLRGAHIGCEDGYCGACTVMVRGRAVKSCMILAIQVDGAEIMTVEGLAPDGELHPIQQAFHEHHGLQCGFCTPAMVLSARSSFFPAIPLRAPSRFATGFPATSAAARDTPISSKRSGRQPPGCAPPRRRTAA